MSKLVFWSPLTLTMLVPCLFFRQKRFRKVIAFSLILSLPPRPDCSHCQATRQASLLSSPSLLFPLSPPRLTTIPFFMALSTRSSILGFPLSFFPSLPLYRSSIHPHSHAPFFCYSPPILPLQWFRSLSSPSLSLSSFSQLSRFSFILILLFFMGWGGEGQIFNMYPEKLQWFEKKIQEEEWKTKEKGEKIEDMADKRPDIV